MKLAIFLGAGASAAENSPIQNELFEEYFSSLSKEDYDLRMNEELYNFFKQIFNIDVKVDDIKRICFPTFEEVLGLIDLSEQRGEFFKSFGLETIHNKSDSIRLIRQYLILLMAKTLKKTEKSYNMYHKKLVENLNKEDMLLDTEFISVNYDIHIDNTLASLYKISNHKIMLDYGVDFSNYNLIDNWKKPIQPTIKLHKIHGSINWLYCPICNSLTLTPYEGGVMRLLNNIEEAKCLECGGITVPIIVPPTYFKNISNIFLTTVWHNVEKSLRDKDILIFCGYSFPESDIHIKYMLKRIQTSRKKNPLKILVFNNHEGKSKSSLDKEEERYKRFLGDSLIFTNNSFQEFSENPFKYISEINNK